MVPNSLMNPVAGRATTGAARSVRDCGECGNCGRVRCAGAAVCAREFDRLADDVAKRVTDLADDAKGLKPDVRRSPGRCIVQLGPVALTLSWLRTRAETVSQGRLLIVEWHGTVGANGAQEYV